MMSSILGSLMYVKGRRAMEIFSPALRELWKDWELRAMVLASLALQMVLIFCGNHRKYSSKVWIRIVLWCAYLMADWVATVALGVISNNLGDAIEELRGKGKGSVLDADAELTAFWAPILLLHLGGPDTITAYSLEDNELWLRHLLGLGVQAGVALYIILMAWTGTRLSLLSAAMFVTGIVKYGERTWALRSASSEVFRDSMLTPADPGPNYAKFMQEYTLKQFEGFHVTAEEVIETQLPVSNPSLAENNARGDGDELLTAHKLLHVFKRLFVELILGFDEREKSRSLFREISLEKAFKVVEIELGFVYDMLYTKAQLIYSLQGCCLRFISFVCTFSVLIFFSLANHKHTYCDLVITYLLLIVAVFLEIYAIFLFLSSDWTDLWLNRQKKSYVGQAITRLKLPKHPRWSNSMAQFNALSFYLREDDDTFCRRVQKLLCLDTVLERHWYTKYKRVPNDLRQLIFEHLKEKSANHDAADIKTICTSRGERVLDGYDKLHWSVKVDFDHSVLIWHIATHICCYKSSNESVPQDDGREITSLRESSEIMSQYMVYLLIMCPFMLPVGIGMIRFLDTQAELSKFYAEHKSIHIHGLTGTSLLSRARRNSTQDKTSACIDMLMKVSTAIAPVKVKGDRSKSVLFEGCRLASQLQELRGGQVERWRVISKVWAEMLACAASQCRGNHHAQQLRRGGELLTHVWLLMAHFGLTEQFQISQGHARVKLVVK